MDVFVFATDGLVYPQRVSDDPHERLSDLQQLVGGDVEIVSLPDGTNMYVNEWGKARGLPQNRNATIYCWSSYGDGVLVGQCVLVGAADEEGEDTSIDLATVQTRFDSLATPYVLTGEDLLKDWMQQ